MLSGAVSVFSKILAMRKVKILVLPVPGPATTITGPSMASTASFWALFSFLYSFLYSPSTLSVIFILYPILLSLSQIPDCLFPLLPLWLLLFHLYGVPENKLFKDSNHLLCK